MSIITLEAQTRLEKGRKTSALRAQGMVPAIVYGADTVPQMITVNRVQFIKTYREAGESSVVELKVDDAKDLHVIIQDYQTDPIRDEVTHIDFRSVDMNTPIEAIVTLEFIGESPAVKALGGTLVQSRDHVTVRALPAKLPRTLQVDLATLQTFDDSVHVSDLVIPEGAEIIEEGRLSIAGVSKPRTKAQMDALEEPVEEAEVPAEAAAAEGADADEEKKAE